MKVCPKCQKQYSDDSLNFCLDDGTVLRNIESVHTGQTPMGDPMQTSPSPIPSVNAQMPSAISSANSQKPKGSGRKTILVVMTILLLLSVPCGIITAWVGFNVWNTDTTVTSSDSDSKKDTSNDKREKIDSTSKREINVVSPIKDGKYNFSTWKAPNNDIVKSKIGADGAITIDTKDGYYYIMLTRNMVSDGGSVILKLQTLESKDTKIGDGLVVNSDPSKIMKSDYAFLIRTKEKAFRIVRHKDQKELVIVDWTKTSAINDENVDNILEVKSSDGSYSFYINGTKVRTQKDFSDLEGGVAGIYAGGGVRTKFFDLEKLTK